MKKNKKGMIRSRFCILLNTIFANTKNHNSNNQRKKKHTQKTHHHANQKRNSVRTKSERHLTENHIARKSVDMNKNAFPSYVYFASLSCYDSWSFNVNHFFIGLVQPIRTQKHLNWTSFRFTLFSFTWQVETIKAVNSKEAVVAGSHDTNHTKFIN